MCIILFAWQEHPRYQLILAANRDEFYHRPSAPAHFWPEKPQVLAGQDLEQQGTWMGITTDGRFAALTNYRDPQSLRPNTVSRGKLVSEYLIGDEKPAQYMAKVEVTGNAYNGFNLLIGQLGSGGELLYYSNRGDCINPVLPGVHGLSNHLLNTAWPKVERGVTGLRNRLAQSDQLTENAFWELLNDTAPAEEHRLPATGVSREWERVLSPIFISSPEYGTRASTVILVHYDGTVRFVERSYQHAEERWETREFNFSLL